MNVTNSVFLYNKVYLGNGPGTMMIYEGDIFMYNVTFNGNISPVIGSVFLVLSSSRLIVHNSNFYNHTSVVEEENMKSLTD